jgi:putative ABC transport system permease protein
MKIINRITLQALRKNRGRTVITILGIMLSVTMVCAVSGYFYSLYDFAYRSAISQHGDSHMSFKEVLPENASKIAADPRFDPEYTRIEDAPDGLKNVYVRLATKEIVAMDVFRDIYNMLIENQVSTNTDYNHELMLIEGYGKMTTNVEDFAIAVISSFLIIIIGGCSILFIANSFYISSSERTKQFGLLKSVGATGRQIRRSVYAEALFLALIAIPAGIIAGFAVQISTLSILNQILISNKIISGSEVTLLPSFNPGIIAMTCIITLAVILLSAWRPAVRAGKLSAMDAIRQSKDIKIRKRELKVPRITSKIFGFEGTLAAKSLKRSRGKYRSAVVSLVVSIVLFVSVSSLVAMITEATNNRYGVSPHNVSLEAGYSSFSFRDSDRITPQKALELRTKVQTQIEAYMNGKNDVSFTTFRRITLGTEYYYEASQNDYFITPFRTDDYNKWRNEYSMGRQNWSDYFVSIPDSEFAKLAPGAAGDFPVVLVNTSGVIVFEGRYQAFKPYNAAVGETFRAAESHHHFSPDSSERSTKTTMTIAGVVDYVPAVLTDYGWYGAAHWLMPESAYMRLLERYPDKDRKFYYVTADDPAGFCEDINEFFDGLTFDVTNEEDIDTMKHSLRVYNLEEAERENRTIAFVIALFGYGFIVMLSLVAVASVISTISTSMALRHREFAILYSIGMTEKGMDKMLNLESLLYGFKSLLYGVPVSIIGVYALFRVSALAHEIPFPVQWVNVLICAAVVFLLTFGTMRYSKRKLRGINIVETLRNETA